MVNTVLIPGGGGPAAIGVIKALKLAGFTGKTVCVDSNSLSPGLHLADVGYVVPKQSDSSFWSVYSEIIEKESVDLIFPTSGFDIISIAEHKKELANKGVLAFLSEPDAISNCLDKWKFHLCLQNKLPVAKTSLDKSSFNFPFFAKPRFGKGSVGVVLCKNSSDLQSLHPDKEYIFQEYLPGEEYTIDVLSDLDGNALCAIPRIRLEVKAGISSRGRIIVDKDLQKSAMDIANVLKLKGVTCIQFKRSSSGQALPLEVNPRFGGGTIMAALAGVNLPGLMLTMAEGNPYVIPEPRPITVVRYYEELILSEEKK
jgi:carbamoyl-phosphate synthase large subunit